MMIVAAFIFLLASPLVPRCSSSDIDSDKQALLEFASLVPHSRKLNWNTTNPICTSWTGVTCSKNNARRVTALRLPGSGLYGPLPDKTFEKLDALRIISLRSNNLQGNIPSAILSLPFIRSLYFHDNNFSGPIPHNILSHRLVNLDLSNNSLSGTIPASLTNLTQLTDLSLQNNSLTGPIPDLPPNLKYLNLSFNNLNGSVPSSIKSFPASSFRGNTLLCGGPLTPCPDNTTTITPVLSTPAIVGIAVGGSVLLFLLLAVVTLCCAKKRDGGNDDEDAPKAKPGRRRDDNNKAEEEFGSGVQEAEKNKLVFFEGSSYSFDLEDLLRASAEVLGKGSYGTTYKAILEEGTRVVVKRLKEVAVGKREFEQQMEAVGRMGPHANVAPLRAYYFSKDEKLLVYDYYRGGSFSTLLHGKEALDWETRLRICLGAARGISHIHSASTGGKLLLLHGNIKSPNVLLTRDLDACVSDYGIAPLMSHHALLPSRSLGYRAPEAVETRKHTQKSDVYSFGVLLLEMLTGKAAGKKTGGNHEEAVDLPKWVQSVVREEWTGEVFDVELIKQQDSVEEEMVQTLQIAMACVSKHPDSRPSMEEVVSMMEEIRPSAGSRNRASSPEMIRSSDSPV
ncbi:putative inactive receptor kinase [Raphanus sativus]|uniref:Probable inactive receptor kinase At3g08680 n=1 Tax=Raphanus sativus TaxID=3726 RepID=A0A6J0K2L3_RAPSA|nr:probable inactive receptor kinase At3g08680 [Raphanus sativus]KAJ4885965.1 putative inactive receptor kinase [Raphanus sativus]